MMFNTGTDTSFMQSRYSIKLLINNYKNEIKKLRQYASSPAEESKLQYYFQAAETINRSTLKDKVQFALTMGRGQSGMVPQIKEAFPMIIGDRVTQPSPIDLAYARLLLDYAIAFDANKCNLKDWMLKFVISSKFSPVRQFVQQYFDYVITQTKQRIANYETMF